MTGFCVRGHSGFANAGSDIVCAAVSAMTSLTVNLLTETFGVECDLKVDGGKADISLGLKRPSDVGGKVIAAFRAEMARLAEEYPQNILVKE